MLANVGPLDRTIRIILGVVLIALAVTGPEVEWGWIGLLPLVTGLARYCPLYALFGYSTCRP